MIWFGAEAFRERYRSVALEVSKTHRLGPSVDCGCNHPGNYCDVAEPVIYQEANWQHGNDLSLPEVSQRIGVVVVDSFDTDTDGSYFPHLLCGKKAASAAGVAAVDVLSGGVTSEKLHNDDPNATTRK